MAIARCSSTATCARRADAFLGGVFVEAELVPAECHHRAVAIRHVQLPGIDLTELGEKIGGADYVRATQAAHRLGRQMAAFHDGWDVLLTPGLATLPVKLGWLDMMMDDVDEYWRRVFAFSPFTVWFNLTGQPAMMLPLGGSPEGLPVASQLVARYGDEATLFRLAAQLEAAHPWFDRKPALAS